MEGESADWRVVRRSKFGRIIGKSADWRVRRRSKFCCADEASADRSQGSHNVEGKASTAAGIESQQT